MELALWVYFIETVLTIDIVPEWYLCAVLYGVVLILIGLACDIRADVYEVEFKTIWEGVAIPTYKPAAWIIGTVFALNLIGQFIPTKETAYTMAAAYGIGEVYKSASESEDVQRLASKSLLVLEQSLDKYLSEEPVEETSDQATEEE